MIDATWVHCTSGQAARIRKLSGQRALAKAQRGDGPLSEMNGPGASWSWKTPLWAAVLAWVDEGSYGTWSRWNIDESWADLSRNEDARGALLAIYLMTLETCARDCPFTTGMRSAMAGTRPGSTSYSRLAQPVRRWLLARYPR